MQEQQSNTRKSSRKRSAFVYLTVKPIFLFGKDAAKPFIVETSQLSVKVLGTRFNVKAYTDDELVTTTLTSGKVEVTPPVQGSQILKPNEQLTYDKKHLPSTLLKFLQPMQMAGSRKLIFTDAPFTEILQTLERRYNVTINHTMNVPASKRYTVRS